MTTATSPDERIALVLDAGGARSAYQVGALAVLLPAIAARGPRPSLLVGTSAGALLTGALTATAHLEPDEQATRLLDVLLGATKKNVMQPLWRQAPMVLARYASETLGASGFRLRGLMGTGPLARTLERSIDWDRLHRNVEDGLVEVSAVTATSVRTGWVTMFAEATSSYGDLPDPPREHHRCYAETRLGVEHLMASSAIPVLFPSIKVTEPESAAGWYVDGATRRRVPLAPALELGADRVVIVGTGSLRPADPDPEQDQAAVDLGDGGATLLGAVMDDPLRHDLRMLTSVNALAGNDEVAPHLNRHRAEIGRPPFRVTPVRRDRAPDLRRARRAWRWRSSGPTTAAPPHPRPGPADGPPAARQRQPAAGRAAVLPALRPGLLHRGRGPGAAGRRAVDDRQPRPVAHRPARRRLLRPRSGICRIPAGPTGTTYDREDALPWRSSRGATAPVREPGPRRHAHREDAGNVRNVL